MSSQQTTVGCVFTPIHLNPTTTNNWLTPQSPSHFTATTDCCPICTESTTRTTVSTICGHLFHHQCLVDWFSSLNTSSSDGNAHMTCPMCRTVLASVGVRPLEEGEVAWEGEWDVYRVEAMESEGEWEPVCESREALREEQEWLVGELRRENEERVEAERQAERGRRDWVECVEGVEQRECLEFWGWYQ